MTCMTSTGPSHHAPLCFETGSFAQIAHTDVNALETALRASSRRDAPPAAASSRRRPTPNGSPATPQSSLATRFTETALLWANSMSAGAYAQSLWRLYDDTQGYGQTRYALT